MTTHAQRLGGLLVAVLLCAGCRDEGLTGLTSSLRFEPTSVTFDPMYVDGAPRLREVSVVNEGRVTLDVAWEGLAGPFSAEFPARLQPGATTVTLRFAPTVAGRYSQKLLIRSPGYTDQVGLPIDALAREIPTCTPSSPCRTAAFDRVTETCVEQNAPDDSACDPGTKCLVNPRCAAGRCVGDALPCDDANQCTVDVCYPLTGCEFLPAPPCPGDGACLEGVCNPATGCGLAPRPDGTTCGGLSSSCIEANVCIEGACVKRDPPDGFVCQEASPCNPGGRCLGEVCVMNGPTTTLQPTWSLDTLAVDVDAGVAPARLHDFVMEPDGALSLGGFFDVPSVLRANTASPLTAPLGVSRRCILWGARYVCADYPSAPNGQVSAIDLATGDALWTFNIRTARPDFLDVASTIFLARLVVQDSDRLAALFEAYPKNATGDSSTQCRAYFLAVIDASGQLVQAQQLVDPLFDTCNHPHPYGVAADALGNLFIAYSPTVSNQAPLVPDTTTLLMSFSRDGVFRWKRLNTGMRGGELAVARGLLYAEYTTVVLDATSGVPLFSLPEELGRAVVSKDRLLPAPVEGGTALRGYEAGVNTLRWTANLPAPWRFWSDQVRLAKWSTSKGPRTVALTWVKDGSTGTTALQGIDLQEGALAFTCPVAVGQRTPPQLFEVGNEVMGMMNGALDTSGAPGCVKCDPPLAGSAGAFWSWDVKTLLPAEAPWVGTFGGAGHDHREN